MQDRYVDAICKEMEMRKDEAPDGLRTIYIGGGTPSLLTESNLQKIFNKILEVFYPSFQEESSPVDSSTSRGGPCGRPFALERQISLQDFGLKDRTDDHKGRPCKRKRGLEDISEVTIECNPDDITDSFCEILRQLPINRVSMGAQTFSDERLKFLHRRHTASEVLLAVERLRKVGIRNISIDLMFGFPSETLEDWEKDINEAISLRPEHISAYSLQYEEGTPLFHLLEQGRIHEIDDELYRRMYTLLCDKLKDAGYEHYEISNFALPGFRSKHNSSYWHNVPYIGLGTSAHSYSGRTRSWNISNLTKYIDFIEKGERNCESETIDEQTHYDDMVMTALRTCEGIDLDRVPDRYRTYLLSQAKSYIRDGEMQYDGHRITLTQKGIFISDMIMSDLMMPE